MICFSDITVDKVTNIANLPFSEVAYTNGLFHAAWTSPGAALNEHCDGETSDVTISNNAIDMSGVCDQPANPGFSK